MTATNQIFGENNEASVMDNEVYLHTYSKFMPSLQIYALGTLCCLSAVWMFSFPSRVGSGHDA